MRRCPWRAAAAVAEVEARGAGARRASVRPEYADLVSADDLARFDQFVRAGGTRRLP